MMIDKEPAQLLYLRKAGDQTAQKDFDDNHDTDSLVAEDIDFVNTNIIKEKILANRKKQMMQQSSAQRLKSASVNK